MKNKIIRTFTVTLAAMLCLTAFSTTAFAGGTDPNHRRHGAGGRTCHPRGQRNTGG